MDPVQAEVEQSLEMIQTLIDALMEFGVSYGFQIIGALFFLFIGLKVAAAIGAYVTRTAMTKDVDQTLAGFIGMVVKLLIVGILIIITLGNFGISIGPLVAMAGASAFGLTIALQGPLSNFGAGLGIILTRPFAVGNTITVGGASGVVEKIAMGVTVLVGEDDERITIPNKEIVGQVIVNSQDQRVVQTRVAIAGIDSAEKTVTAVKKALESIKDVNVAAKPQVGIHDFTYGGYVLGVRFWVPSAKYFQVRYAVNRAILDALSAAKVPMLQVGSLSLQADSLSADDEETVDS
ncbi:MAG: mechanosensitive ion channel family protein [Rhodospirillales bacterium]|jgi:small conductance mechanosensitive channel|nr:mechanosensitive ion channel family protein [Rhodospirillales bacterium]MBT4039234.1 mechanosensitive ion channel family protein [Rhodospirillales bacterium]MBT4626938.1 mechanosensitive ion channel family protein [Rhodospirillales bacterium]MBT5352470.1 mechanosensitive ion channel family protein [Rhodospirillales bacterium]MBT5521085.1 mechanosensitive ion channel family protein [Rhodospirillales bacterium]